MPKRKTSKRVKRKPKQKACDYGHFANKVHRLNTGGNSGVYLCRKHWADEMKWRKERNKTLDPGAKFPILKWRS